MHFDLYYILFHVKHLISTNIMVQGLSMRGDESMLTLRIVQQ